uniref:Bm11075 n=1 Tax=Brugia malayi TaxID=6279 RepID=A0A0I9N8T0_BRUMA|nr:Bm11075 [Brugia malayi]
MNVRTTMTVVVHIQTCLNDDDDDDNDDDDDDDNDDDDSDNNDDNNNNNNDDDDDKDNTLVESMWEEPFGADMKEEIVVRMKMAKVKYQKKEKM